MNLKINSIKPGCAAFNAIDPDGFVKWEGVEFNKGDLFNYLWCFRYHKSILDSCQYEYEGIGYLIYFLFGKDSETTNKNKILYIGQSGSINRIHQHSEKNEIPFRSFTIVDCYKYVLDEWEAEFILLFKPKYNQQLPSNRFWKTPGQLSSLSKENIYTVKKLLTKNKIEKKIFNHELYYWTKSFWSVYFKYKDEK